MTSLLDFLPFLDGWRHRNIVKTNLTITRGRLTPIYKEDFAEGWVTSATYNSNDPDVTFVLRVEEKGYTKSLSVQPSLLNTMGLINPNNNFPWVSVYNVAASVFWVMYAPARPWSFTGGFTADVLLPTTAASATALINLVINRVVLVDKDAFVKSFRRLQSPLSLQEIEEVKEKLKIFMK